MVSTKLIEKLFVSRQKEIDTYTTQAEAIQEKVFRKLTAQASDTEWGKKYDFAHIRSYADFQRVPIQQYDDIKGYVDRMRHGEKDVLWPGRVIWYAKSSGTTSDKSKFIPVSKDGLKHIHYRGGTDAVALYLRSNPESRFFSEYNYCFLPASLFQIKPFFNARNYFIVQSFDCFVGGKNYEPVRLFFCHLQISGS